MDDPIVAEMRDAVSPEMIEAGEQVRAVDAALVAGQLARALGPEHPRPVYGPFPDLTTPRPSLLDKEW